MLQLPFDAEARPARPSEIQALLKLPEYDEVIADVCFPAQAHEFAIFGGMCFVGMQHDEEYAAFDIASGSALNVVFALRGAALGVGVVGVREPAQICFINDVIICKYAFRVQIPVARLSGLLELRSFAICAPLRAQPLFVENAAGELHVSYFCASQAALVQCTWALSDESAVQHARELRAQRLANGASNVEELNSVLNRVIDVDMEAAARIGIVSSITRLGDLLTAFRNIASHAAADTEPERLPNYWTELCENVEDVYPRFFLDLAEIDRV